MICLLGFCEVCNNDDGMQSDLLDMKICDDCWEEKIKELIEVK